MSDVVDLMVSFPTVIFTVPLVFFLLWFILGIVVSGIDIGDADFDLDIDHDGHISGFEHVAGALHLGALGLPLAMLMVSLGGWASSLIFSVAARQVGWDGVLMIVTGTTVAALAGFAFVWKVGGALGRGLDSNPAPGRDAAVGCTCKVRTVEVTPTFGDAEVLDGPVRTSIVKVRAATGQFRRGDLAVLGELDADTNSYWISPREDDASSVEPWKLEEM